MIVVTGSVTARVDSFDEVRKHSITFVRPLVTSANR